MRKIHFLLIGGNALLLTACQNRCVRPFRDYDPPLLPCMHCESSDTTKGAKSAGLIDPGDYTGCIQLDKSGSWIYPATLTTLSDGPHTLGVGQSLFGFNVSNGQVNAVDETAAAEIDGGRLKLKTLNVKIDPGDCDGVSAVCRLTNQFKTVGGMVQFDEIDCARQFHLMPDLIYTLDSGAAITMKGSTSYTFFLVTRTGEVWEFPASLAAPYSAGACDSEVRLHPCRVRITPLNNDTSRYRVGGFGKYASGVNTITAIMGLTTMVVRENSGAEEGSYFTPYYFTGPVHGKVVCGGVEYFWEIVP